VAVVPRCSSVCGCGQMETLGKDNAYLCDKCKRKSEVQQKSPANIKRALEEP
jgi:tRNA(Ile2) C34 agmatinyltransferase TiaS